MLSPPYWDSCAISAAASSSVALAVVLILGGVAIDLLFSAHPALSMGLLLSVAALIALVGLLMHGRVWPRRFDKRR
jgi:hypothetical protein